MNGKVGLRHRWSPSMDGNLRNYCESSTRPNGLRLEDFEMAVAKLDDHRTVQFHGIAQREGDLAIGQHHALDRATHRLALIQAQDVAGIQMWWVSEGSGRNERQPQAD